MSNELAIATEATVMERAVSASKSTIVPEMYRRSVDNCIIAINLADAMGLNVLTVMQNLYVVHNKPAWAAVFSISRWNTCGKYSPIRYEVTGTPGKSGSSCTATSTDLATGDVLRGTPITWEMVTGEEWTKNPKWRNMPEQMFRYRAASFLIKTFAPELLMGLPFSDEVVDAHGNEQVKGRRPLPKPKTVQSEVVDATPPAIEGPQVSEEMQAAFNKAIDGLGRATLTKHIEWFDNNISDEVFNSWTDEMQNQYTEKKREAAARIKPETPEQAFRRCLAEIGPMSVKEANEHIKTFDTGEWREEWGFELTAALEAKASK